MDTFPSLLDCRTRTKAPYRHILGPSLFPKMLILHPAESEPIILFQRLCKGPRQEFQVNPEGHLGFQEFSVINNEGFCKMSPESALKFSTTVCIIPTRRC